MSPTTDVHPGLRLAPIDRPPTLLLRLVGFIFRRRFGKVMMPLRVLHARMPGYLWPYLWLIRFSESGLSLPEAIRHLVPLQVSRLNGCDFCADLHEAVALEAGQPGELLAALDQLETSRHFDGRTRAALRYATEVTCDRNASDETFDALRVHFDERQIVELVWLVAFTFQHNLIARPLGLQSDGFCDLVAERARRQLPAAT